MLLGEGPKRGEQIVRATFDAEPPAATTPRGRRRFGDGFVAEHRAAEPDRRPSRGRWRIRRRGRKPSLPAGDGLEVVFCESEQLFDGRFANNGWLQETPHVLTKVTWDNVALVSFEDAREERASPTKTSIDLTPRRPRRSELPAYLMPGQAVGSIGVALGYGRTAAGPGRRVRDRTAAEASGVEPVGTDVVQASARRTR